MVPVETQAQAVTGEQVGTAPNLPKNIILLSEVIVSG